MVRPTTGRRDAPNSAGPAAAARRLRRRRALRVARRRLAASTCARSSCTGRASTTSRWATARRSCFVHGLSGCWQNWLENIPHFARAPPGDRARPRRLRRVRAAARGDQHPGYGRFIDALPAADRDRARRRWSATRWAASSRPRRRSAIRAASRSWCWCPPPGSLRVRNRQLDALERAARLLASAHAPRSSPDASTACAARGCAGAMLYGVVQLSRTRIAPELLLRGRERRRQARLPRRPQRDHGLRLPRPAAGDRGADADRLGPQRPRSCPVAGRATSTSA